MAYTTIDDPSAYFHTQLYTGNGNSTHAITNNANAGNFKPDWLWIKQRSQSGRNHSLWDSSRGTTKRLISNNADAEETQAGDQKTFDTNGFTVGGGSITNENSQTFVAWQWKCNGGTSSTNSSGSINSGVQVNTTAGFSIVLYPGNETAGATVGHGFSSAPDVVIIKRRTGGTGYWIVNSNNLDAQGTTGGSPDAPRNMYFNSTDNAQSDKICQAINATTFTLSNSNSGNANTDDFVAYCFKEVKGYSKFGHYEGNGNNDGPFIYTGFKPAWLIVKASSGGANNWFIIDNKRDSYQNPFSDLILADESTAENADTPRGDLLSNGFKWRTNPAAFNGDGSSYFYMAFAESPFVSSAGVPTTAK